MTHLWIVGQIDATDHLKWAFQGIFDTEEKAVAACRDRNYFVGPCILNQERPHENKPWPGSYYPKVKCKEHKDKGLA